MTLSERVRVIAEKAANLKKNDVKKPTLSAAIAVLKNKYPRAEKN